jgi:RNA recognition motif-containing protein
MKLSGRSLSFNPQGFSVSRASRKIEGGALMPTKLYVGNLAYSVTNEDLEGLFSQAGKVDTAVVVVDKFSGQSRGFGFVEMADSNDAARAIEEFNDTELKGRNIRVNEARPREGGGGGGPRGGGGGGGGRDRRGGGRNGGGSGGGGGGGGGNRRW